MPPKIKKSKADILRNIRDDFNLTFDEIKRIIKDFRIEMMRGLAGRKSSLKMLPTYIDKPSGEEKGRWISLDLGGTHLRIVQLELKGKGKIIKLHERKIVLGKKYRTGKELFDFIARFIKDFIEEELNAQDVWELGFTFSFPIEQLDIASGILVRWTKGFSLKGVVGKDVVQLLHEALIRQGVRNIRIAALVNDTVGTLVTRCYQDTSCDIGVILGTGTNACYREKAENLALSDRRESKGQRSMIVNIEWGNFNKINRTFYDKLLDRSSGNPGHQILEKMVSGMYLGEIVRLILADLVRKKLLFTCNSAFPFKARGALKSEYMSRIEKDRTAHLLDTDKLLKQLGIMKSSLDDRLLVKKICALVSTRAARLSAAALAGVITKIDRRLSRKHTIAIDGTVYEKYPGFSKNMKFVLKRLFAGKSDKIKMVLTKDGSGLGAAIAASTVSTI